MLLKRPLRGPGRTRVATAQSCVNNSWPSSERTCFTQSFATSSSNVASLAVCDDKDDGCVLDPGTSPAGCGGGGLKESGSLRCGRKEEYKARSWPRRPMGVSSVEVCSYSRPG